MAATNDGSGVPDVKESEQDILLEMQALSMRAQTMSREEIQTEIQNLTTRLQNAKTPKQEVRMEPRLATTQKQPLQGMQKNRAGGYSYVVDDLTKMKRYIVIGSEKSIHMVTERKNAQENIKCVIDLIEQNRGKEVIDTIEEYALQSRVSKEENILMILRDCATYKGTANYDENTSIQKAAYERVAKICNIPTKLFRFLQLCEPRIQQNWNPKIVHLSKKQRKRKAETKPEEENEIPSKKKKKKKNKKGKGTNGNPGKGRIPKKSSSWGRMRRNGVGAFYTDTNKDANRLLLLLTKYKSRHEWSHQQVLGYAHPKITDDEKEAKDIVLTYVTRGYEKFESYLKKKEIGNGGMISESTSRVIEYIKVLNDVQKLSHTTPGDEEKLLNFLKEYGQRKDADKFTEILVVPSSDNKPISNPGKKKIPFQLVREHIPTGFLKSAPVWEALLQDMPMTALIRNLGKMTSIGLFDETKKKNIDIVVKKLNDANYLKYAKIHPVKVLIALKIYQQGHGDKGHEFELKKENPNPLTWRAVNDIADALDNAFYLSFKQSENQASFKTGKKFMLALDVSGSMTWSGCHGCEQLTPAVASTALAMVTWNIEEHCKVMAFGGHLESLENRLSKDMKLTEAMQKAQGINFGRTDCSLPMTHALEKKMDIDVFIIYTDSDTWAGRIHPSEALVRYRKEMNKPDAKLLVLAMQSTGFTIADPEDPFMMDICGFDSDVPDIIFEFAKGNIS